MNGSVWVTTFRRPEMVQECVGSLIHKGVPIKVLVPPDEEHKFPRGVEQIIMPEEVAFAGAAAPRTYAGVLAANLGDDFIMFADDDIVVDDGVDLSWIGKDFNEYANLGVLKGGNTRFAYHWNDKKSPLVVVSGIGAFFGFSMQAYEEAGGIDPEMKRFEDTDLEMRVKIIGYDCWSDHRVRFLHKCYQDGGIQASEASEGSAVTNQQQAFAKKIEWGKRLMDKYPSGLCVPHSKPSREAQGLPPSWYYFGKGALKEMRMAYAEGRLRVNVKGAQYIED